MANRAERQCNSNPGELAMARFSDEQVESFRARLEQLRTEANERLRKSSESARPVDLGESIGRLTRVDAMQGQQMARTQRLRDEGQLQLIRAALARLEAGTYGQCMKCEEEIEAQRLEIAPESTQCMTCRRASDTR